MAKYLLSTRGVEGYKHVNIYLIGQETEGGEALTLDQADERITRATRGGRIAGIFTRSWEMWLS